LAAAAIAALALGALALSQRTGSGQAPGTVLESISQEWRDRAQVTFQAPGAADRAQARVDAQYALDWSRAHWKGASFPEVALARFADIASDPPVACLCWIVVVDSPQLPYRGSEPIASLDGSPPAKAPASVAESWIRFDLIDAMTGEYMYTVESAKWKDLPADTPPGPPPAQDEPRTTDPPHLP
jgi:hypothetical protein